MTFQGEVERYKGGTQRTGSLTAYQVKDPNRIDQATSSSHPSDLVCSIEHFPESPNPPHEASQTAPQTVRRATAEYNQRTPIASPTLTSSPSIPVTIEA